MFEITIVDCISYFEFLNVCDIILQFPYKLYCNLFLSARELIFFDIFNPPLVLFIFFQDFVALVVFRSICLFFVVFFFCPFELRFCISWCAVLHCLLFCYLVIIPKHTIRLRIVFFFFFLL